FVDREAGDLRLTEESPCIDAGGISHLVFDHFDINRNEDQGEYAPDRDLGVRRMRCADMGAYEFILTGDPPTGDLNGDWAVDFNDLLAVLAAWGPCEGCPEDLSGNDEVDFADVLIVLANWGDCPGAQVTQGSVAECIDRLGYTNPAALAACIEAMIINATP
ncbi:MAG: hypothetical protein KF817_07430, partial [Phycisphaeraceae bacterium]|nr:hypothetical protein [Phycisphaeraceae bacterium]